MTKVQNLEKEYELRLALQKQIKELKSEHKTLTADHERRLSESNSHLDGLQAVIDTALDAVVAINDRGKITDWNQQAETIFGWSREETLGRYMHELIVPEKYRNAHREGFAKYFRTGEGPVLNKRIEIEGVRRNGEIFPIELAITPIIVAGETSFSAFIRDITSRKAVQEATEKARQEAEAASRAKSEFLANMSHEIRTPLNAVIGLSGLMLDENLTDEQRDYLNTIRTSGDNLLSIINDILDFSKIEAGHMTLEEHNFDLRRTVEESLDMVSASAAEKKIDLAYKMGHNTPAFVKGDVTRLRQVLINLLSNAVKFTDEGEIVVSVLAEKSEKTEKAEKAEEMADDGLRLDFSVRDTGIGIPEDRRNRLFKAFSQVDASTTRKYGGTGLGLAITQRLTEMMGGEVTVDSEVDVGSTFSFSVLVKEADMTDDQLTRYAYLDEQQPQLEGLRVLIVDDNATNRHLLEKQLGVWGMRVVSAESGYEALGMLSVEKPFDVAVLDIFMPRMDGVQLSNEIRKHYPKLPQIVLSSSGKSDLGSVDLDVFAYLNKPLKPSQLYNTLCDLFVKNAVKRKKADAPIDIDRELGEKHPLRILVAEDNAINQRVALRLLGRMGYLADVAGNGKEALDALKMQSYDLVLMDIQMPEMDGVEAAQHIIETMSPRPKIVAVTANALKGDREKYLEAGLDEYVSKPIRIEELQTVLQNTLPIDVHTKLDQPPIDKLFLNDQYGEMADEMLEELLPMFQEDSAELLTRLTNGLETTDSDEIRKAAHALKGASYGVGAVILAGLCQTAENYGKNGEMAKVGEKIKAISAEIARISDL